MKKAVGIVLCLFLNLVCASVYAKVTLTDLNIKNDLLSTRLIFDANNNFTYKVFSLDNPARLVVDIDNANYSFSFTDVNLQDTLIKNIRYAIHANNKLRIVFDLKQSVKYKTTNVNKKLTIEFKTNSATRKSPVVKNDYDLISQVVKTKPSVINFAPRDFIIAIDAGHGGEDPGAIGRNGTKEKVVTLKIANLLAKKIQRRPGMQAFLVRKGDYYIPLRKRMKIARAHGADLFISIHADGFTSQKATGASVFILSERGASSEAARWLAQNENDSDLIGGVSLLDKDNLLASVLLDLSQSASVSASLELANNILSELGNYTLLHKEKVEQAGFAVLKSPDIPSVLVETAFISNPIGERNLNSFAYQDKIANAIFNGVVNYCGNLPMPQTNDFEKVNLTKYQVKSGDTLSQIAQKHNVNITKILQYNNLSNSKIKIGQILYLPS